MIFTTLRFSFSDRASVRCRSTVRVSTCTARLPSGSAAGDLALLEGLDDVALLEVLEVGQADAALEALAHLADVVLEALAAT